VFLNAVLAFQLAVGQGPENKGGGEEAERDERKKRKSEGLKNGGLLQGTPFD